MSRNCVLLGLIFVASASGQQPIGRIAYPTPIRDFAHGRNNEYPTPIRSYLHGSHVLPMVPVPAVPQQKSPQQKSPQQKTLDWDRLTNAQKLDVAKYWRWSADAKHHMAIVQVRAGDNGGSGTLVRADGLVITAAHVISGHSQATAIWSTGHQSTGPVIARNQDTDVAAFRVTTPPENAMVIPVTEKTVRIPAWFEYCGYGGPTGYLRHWWAELTKGDADNNHSRTTALNGDSGGAMLVHWEGGKIELAGVIEGSRRRQAYVGEDGQPWPLHYPLRSSKTQHVRDILAQCGPYACPPQYRRQQPQQPRGAPTAPQGQIDPIQRPPQPQPTQPQPTQPQQSCELTNDQLQEIIDALAEDDRFKGPPGAQGEQGPSGIGQQGDPGQDGAPGPGPTDEQIRAAIVAWITSHPTEIADILPPIYMRRREGRNGPIKSVDQIHLGQGWTFNEFPLDQLPKRNGQ